MFSSGRMRSDDFVNRSCDVAYGSKTSPEFIVSTIGRAQAKLEKSVQVLQELFLCLPNGRPPRIRRPLMRNTADAARSRDTRR